MHLVKNWHRFHQSLTFAGWSPLRGHVAVGGCSWGPIRGHSDWVGGNRSWGVSGQKGTWKKEQLSQWQAAPDTHMASLCHRTATCCLMRELWDLACLEKKEVHRKRGSLDLECCQNSDHTQLKVVRTQQAHVIISIEGFVSPLHKSILNDFWKSDDNWWNKKFIILP